MATKNQASGGVSRQVLADHVYEALLVALMDGRLEAGTPVSIDGMARELDVSPTPVREALAGWKRPGWCGGWPCAATAWHRCSPRKSLPT